MCKTLNENCRVLFTQYISTITEGSANFVKKMKSLSKEHETQGGLSKKQPENTMLR